MPRSQSVEMVCCTHVQHCGLPDNSVIAGGDISLGCWTASGQIDSCKPASSGPVGSPCQACHDSTIAMPSETAKQSQHAVEVAGSTEMDLTNYFATLPNEEVPFRDLISPMPVSLLLS